MSDGAKLDAFMAERPRLFRLAYRYLETASDAEDVLQDTWIRFSGAETVDNPPRFLSTVVTRLALDRLKSAQRRRETYVGPWLPEPLVDTGGLIETGPSDAALDLSFAVMRCLEALSPAERAAFFLHDIYDVPFDEVARVTGVSPAAARKQAERARRALAEARPRFKPELQDIARLEAAFRAASQLGDDGPLRALLSEEVEFVSDGGGKAVAARNIVRGLDNVARLFMGLIRGYEKYAVRLERAAINGEPGLIAFMNDELVQTVAFRLDDERRISAFYVVRNPDKLARAGQAV
ncbi:MAG: RNA polymerase sigma factor SigJ [Rhizobiaceae bacterium]